MTEDYLIGKKLDEYQIEALLGRGGMARVYRAFDTRLKRWVAVKVIATPFRSDSDYIMRFEREAQAIAQLEHANVVTVYRYGEVDDMLYIAMQYVEGVALDTLLHEYRDEEDYIPSADVLKIMRDICQALDYIHSKGVVHRDIKPANIILNKDGQAILADFGLALLESAGTQGEIFGTPHYIAPEQAISSAGAVPHSDLYAVGVILYEMFTGTVPFDADSAMSIAMQHMSEPPEPPRQIRSEISPALESVLLKTLEKEPEDRYTRGIDLVVALEHALQIRQITSVISATPHVSVLDRVAVELAERPMPPMPAGVSTVKPEPTSPAAAAAEPVPVTIPEAKGEPTQPQQPSSETKKSKNSMLYGLIGLVAILLLGLCGLAVGGWFVFGRDSDLAANSNDSNQKTVNQSLKNEATPTPVVPEPDTTLATTDEVAPSESEPTATPIPSETATSVIVPSNTPEPPAATNSPTTQPTATETPVPLPTDTPTPDASQPIADTTTDFSGTQGTNNWRYMWSRDRESFNWVEMQYDGTCWRISEQESVTEPSVRICQYSAHPGVTGDIAWRWESTVDGSVWVHVIASKIDTSGGNGVDVVVYRNTDELQRWHLDGDDSNGFSDGLSVPVSTGDFVFTVLKIADDPSYDETSLRAQIYP